MMTEPPAGKDPLKINWEYKCSMDDKDGYTTTGLNAGGNVTELPGQCVFASMGMQYSKLFIVNRNKEIVWSAMSEKWDEQQKKWQMTSSYKASIITTRKDLEQLIWNAENHQYPSGQIQ
jgi:hypothetical protein